MEGCCEASQKVSHIFISRKGGEALFEVCRDWLLCSLKNEFSVPIKSLPALLNSSSSPLRKEQRRFFEAYAKPCGLRNLIFRICHALAPWREQSLIATFALCVANGIRHSLWWNVRKFLGNFIHQRMDWQNTINSERVVISLCEKRNQHRNVLVITFL